MSVRVQPMNNGEELQYSNDIKVILNVGGQRHETHLSTLNNFTDTRLTWISEQIKLDPRPNREFFFDRHPGLFSHILNYFRTGKLHAPRDICGPMFAEELSYWGIDSKLIEPCCWSYFDEHNELEEKLQGFGALDDKDSTVESLFEDDEDDENFDDLSDGYPEADRAHRSEKFLEQARKSWQRYCKVVWRLLENPYSSTVAWVISFVSLILTFLIVVLFCISTLPNLDETHKDVGLYPLEAASICWFTVEFLIRLVTTPDKKAFFKTMQTWVELLAIFPFYLQLGIPKEKEERLNVLKLLYVLRLYRAFRAFRFSYVLQVFIQTIKGSFRELFLLFFIFTVLVITYGSLAFYAENNGNGIFSSIPASFWWSLITMTTVGYGDMVPSTLFGKLVGGACALSGVLMMALPVSVVASNFSLYNNYAKVKLKLPPRPEKKILNSALQSMKFNAPETSIASTDELPRIPNGRRRSYRSRSRYSSVIPTLEEEERNDEEIEMTNRKEIPEERSSSERKCLSKSSNGSPMPSRTREVRISIPEISET
ncbi:potassium voltage-gated channel subfamily C member 1-like [Dendronephthya gigantea]|uniref:potassium voltage-gated channel subfamily C member 1-like n=1 Tax=Dendronephthya gigantea TaxID=151771 RepID=UPI00106969BF|nr:potassium voltage-gated channel subfamily C member 1-like [Dendronephthya gigantea]